MESEQEQEKKQLFLRKEILEQKYEPQNFIDFLISKKGETGADINKWTLEELKSVVIEFKSLNKKNFSSKNDSIYVSENTKNEIQNKLKNKNNNIFYNDELNNEWLFITPESEKDFDKSLNTSNTFSENNKVIEIDCLEPDHSPLNNYDKLHIKIS